MRISEMDTLIAYNWWATLQVLHAADGLPDEQFIDTDIVPIPFGSLRGTLVHALDLERSIRHRLSRNTDAATLDEARFASVDELSRAWRAEATAMKDYLIGLEDEHMDSVFSLNETERYPYWQLLMHMVNHSAQHRTEAAILLTALDRSPGDLDFSLFLKESPT